MSASSLSTWRQLGYAMGMLGWSILTNIIGVMLIYFYLPPNNSGLVALVPQTLIFGVFTVLAIIAASGRLVDALTDPLIAFWSDRFQSKRGRRIPFMAVALVPTVTFCILIFLPYDYFASSANVWWLSIVQVGFYFFMTIYIIPYNALLPELAADSESKVRLSTWLSFTFVLGVIISSQTPGLADLIQSFFRLSNRQEAMQWAIGFQCTLGGFFMLIPLFVINEAKHCKSVPTTLPFWKAFRQIGSNRNFLYFIVADFSYFVSLTIISSSLLYLLRSLLYLEEYIGGQVMGVLVVVSLLFYPSVIRLAKSVGKRKLILFSLWFQGLILFSIYWMGKVPIDPRLQIFGFAILSAVPAAFLGILPFAIIAEIAAADASQTGQQKEAMYFAIRNFSTKLGQTFGISIFAILTIFGKDPGDDFGIRMVGVFGGVLCLVAGCIFLRFKEV
ncbi:MAG: MFS transporter [Saprospiraceae bacterium]